MRYVYDPAKTPLQRLFKSGVLSDLKEQELTQVAQTLDPIRLLHQLEQLQQDLRPYTVSRSGENECCAGGGIGQGLQMGLGAKIGRPVD